jgi:hypothetical protein
MAQLSHPIKVEKIVMNHPFAMSLSDLTDLDLNFETPLTDEEASTVGGGLSVMTKALNEGGGYCEIPLPICNLPPIKFPYCPLPIDPKPCPMPPIKPPIMTTMAVGEEGGICYPLY